MSDSARGATTTVHLLRHGEVDNPKGVLYGRLPGLPPQRARRADGRAGRQDRQRPRHHPPGRVAARARPGDRRAVGRRARARHRHRRARDRVRERLRGPAFGVGDGSLRKPSAWKHLYNPWRPSWGEPYKDVVVRMLAAMHDAREAAAGHEAMIVSHQLPIWIVRSFVEGRRLFHDPRKRAVQPGEPDLASTTTDDRITSVLYSEPAADLVPVQGAEEVHRGRLTHVTTAYPTHRCPHGRGVGGAAGRGPAALRLFDVRRRRHRQQRLRQRRRDDHRDRRPPTASRRRPSRATSSAAARSTPPTTPGRPSSSTSGASWCGECRAEAERLVQASKELAARRRPGGLRRPQHA